MIESLALIVFGWLLGVFAPFLSELIQKRYHRRLFRKSLFIELKDMRVKLAGNVFLLASHNGTMTRELFGWIYPIMSADRSLSVPWFDDDKFRLMLNFSDEQFSAFSGGTQMAGQVPGLKKLSLPFLSSQVNSLSLFPPEFQRAALEILGELSALNEQIDDARSNFEKSFDSSVSTASRQAVLNNLASSYRSLEGTCRQLAKRISYMVD